MPRMADGCGVVVDVRADDRMRAASAPFAMGKFALRGLAQSIARELATCLDQVPKKKYRRAAKETGLGGARWTSKCETFDGRLSHRGSVAFGNPFPQNLVFELRKDGEPFFEAGFGFFEANGRSFASRHGLPPRRGFRRQNDLNSYPSLISCSLAGNSQVVVCVSSDSKTFPLSIAVRRSKWIPGRSGCRGQSNCRNQVDRNCSGRTQETVIDLLAPGG